MSHLFTIREVCQVLEVDPESVRSFVEREWVRPAGAECRSEGQGATDEEGAKGSDAGTVGPIEHYLDDCDLARVRLILDLRDTFGANDESIPLILHLIDQIHSMRERLMHARAHPFGHA